MQLCLPICFFPIKSWFLYRSKMNTKLLLNKQTRFIFVDQLRIRLIIIRDITTHYITNESMIDIKESLAGRSFHLVRTVDQCNNSQWLTLTCQVTNSFYTFVPILHCTGFLCCNFHGMHQCLYTCSMLST